MIKTREQYEVVKTDVTELVFSKTDKMFVLPLENKVIKVPTSENRLYRMYGTQEIRMHRGIETLVKVADGFIIMDFDRPLDNPFLVPAIIKNGFIYDHKVYREVLQSASQTRQGKAMFTSFDTAEVRDNMTYGAKFATDVVMATVEARHGLGLSSTLNVGCDFNHVVIPDTYTKKIHKVRTLVGDKMVEADQELKLNAADGQGTIEVLPACRIANRLGILSDREYTLFVKNFVSLDAMDSQLHKIFNKIPSVFQIRYAGAKGLLVVFPHSVYGMTQDIVFTQSMWKYTPDFARFPQIPLEIADWSKKPKERAFLNYQFLAGLDITGSDVIELAKESLKHIDTGILMDAGCALHFLGLCDSIGSEDGNGDVKLLSRLMYTLNADADMIKDIKVQSDLRKLLQKFVTEMSWGRVPVTGTFAYVICDPRYTLGDKHLVSGQNWYNDEVGESVLFRSPLIEHSEIVKAHFVKESAFRFLHDIIVINPEDDTLPRMGGADTDGDRLMRSNHPLLCKSVAPLTPMVYDAGKKAVPVANTTENLTLYYLQTTSRSNVGKITDLATIWTDIGLHNGDRKLFGDYIGCLRVYQGQEIDAAKSGYHPTVGKCLRTNFIPHWMVTMRGGTVSEDRQIYTSTSALGKLHDFIVEYWNRIKQVKKTQNADMTLKFVAHVDHSIIAKVTETILELENDYRKDLASLHEMTFLGKMTKDEAKIQTEYLFAKYEALIESMPEDRKTIAAIAYDTAYNKNNSKSYSFPWISCFTGLLELLYENKNSMRMTGIEFTTDEFVVVAKDVIEVNTEKYYIGNIPDGNYPVLNINGKSFVKIPYFGTPAYEKPEATHGYRKDIQDKYQGKEIVQFTITGFNHLGLNANSVVDAIVANHYAIAVIKTMDDQVVVYTGDQRIGVMSKVDKLNNIGIIGKTLKISEHQNVQFMGVKSKKLELRKAFYVVASITGEADLTKFSVASPIVVDAEINECNYEAAYMSGYEVDYSQLEVPVYEVQDTEETLAVIDLSIPQEETVLDPVTMSGVRTTASYWVVSSLNKPQGVDSYTTMIVNPSAKLGETVGTVTAYNGNKSWQFEVVRTQTGLIINSTINASKEFCDWVLRVVSYKAAEMRVR